MFQFPGFASLFLCIKNKDNDLMATGFSHSEIFGSELIISLPKLIADYHVLHRLLLPRHPPYALNNLKHITPNYLSYTHY